MRSRRTIALLLALVAGAALALYLLLKPELAVQNLSHDRVAVALPLQPTSIMTFVALEKGYFADRGLDVTVYTFPSGKVAMEEGLFTGRADIAWSNDVPVALAGIERSDFRVLGVDLWADNINKIIARADRGIAQPEDLRGKRLATQRGSAVHYFLHLFLLRHHMTEKDVKLEFLKAEELPPALASGSIDAFSMRDPFISEARDALGGKAVLFEAPGLYEQVDVVVMRKARLDRDPQIAVKTLQALLDAEKFVLEHPRESAAITARFLNVPPSSIEALLPSFRPQVGLAQSWLVLMESEARWAMDTGVATNKNMPNYLELIDAGALRQLRPEAVTLVR